MAASAAATSIGTIETFITRLELVRLIDEQLTVVETVRARPAAHVRADGNIQ
jgi:hypothetical protein